MSPPLSRVSLLCLLVVPSLLACGLDPGPKPDVVPT
jgi:hypothetical protein